MTPTIKQKGRPSMSNVEIIDTTQWPDKALTDAQRENRKSAALIPVRQGGAIPMNFAQMVDYAKFMSTARGAVGAHLMGNVGACLAVMEIANQFGLPAYAVARQSYLVNNRLAFMGQFFHSIVEDHAPLKKGANGRKLQWRYEGADETLKIIVSAIFEGATEPVEYESPIWKDITVKNSPLWKSEPKRQFVYFAVRGWQTINWPEGMLQAISGDEAAALPPSEYARDITPGESLMARLAAARIWNEQSEGFTDGHVEAQIDAMRNGGSAHETVQNPLKDDPPAEAKKADPISSVPDRTEPSNDEAKSDTADKASETPAGAVSEVKATDTAPKTENAQTPAASPGKPTLAYEPTADGYMTYMRDSFDAAKGASQVTELWGSTRVDRTNLLDEEQIAELTKDKAAKLASLKLRG